MQKCWWMNILTSCTMTVVVLCNQCLNANTHACADIHKHTIDGFTYLYERVEGTGYKMNKCNEKFVPSSRFKMLGEVSLSFPLNATV